ncbi:DUF2730 family protein [Methylosinus sp. Sm6]|uniref:DUF2730 family protein n=1 Tax=Methylosinus sp. Sm6 TaxID=2866948 RepID=UPI001C9A196A|nr:DUF2730 family protein [Methylosinus sp. Sm6]MBY6244122.1 DUF2730 domain-containing protein [Methylosinus sp. Sm6]
MMDWGTAAQWAGTAAALAIAVWSRFSNRSDDDVKGMQSDLRRLFERVDGVEVRIGKIEVEVEHLPTKDEVHAIDVKITTLDARVAAMIERVNTLINLYERAQDRLAEAERK